MEHVIWKKKLNKFTNNITGINIEVNAIYSASQSLLKDLKTENGVIEAE